MKRYLAILKSRIYMALPHRFMFALFAFVFQKRTKIIPVLPETGAVSPLFLVNYRGQYVPAITETPLKTTAFRNDTIIHFSSPLKSHRTDIPNETQIDRRIGAPVKLISDVLLRDHVNDPNFITHNFKRDHLNQLGVDRIFVYGYSKIGEPFTVSRHTAIRLYHQPETYFDAAARRFTETALLEKFAVTTMKTRNANGLLNITQYRAFDELLPQFRLTFTAYSYGGEFLHMVRNCLVAYLAPAFSTEQIAHVLDQVTLVTAGSNNPILYNAANFRNIRLVNYYDEHVIKKLDLSAYFPSKRARRAGHTICPLTLSATLVWVDIPYYFSNLSYNNDRRIQKRLTNYQFHLERAYFNPLYFPDIAYNALIESIRNPLAR